MAEPWIRVHANLADKPVVWRAVKELRVSQPEAMGLLVRFWGAMSQHGNDGLVISLTDEQVEAWGGWRGKRGKFAAFIRQYHTDDDGRVNEWDDYAGKLEDRRHKDRERKREERDKKRKSRGTDRGKSATSHADIPKDVPPEVPTDHPRDVTPVSIPARAVRNEDETLRSSSPPSPAGADAFEVASRLASDADRSALEALLLRVPSRITWIAEIQASLDGMSGHACVTPIQAGQAIRDYVGNGATANPSLKHFRSYLEKAARPPSDASPYAPRRRPATNGKKQDYQYPPGSTEEPKWTK